MPLKSPIRAFCVIPAVAGVLCVTSDSFAQLSEVYLTATTSADEFLIPPSPPQDHHVLSVTTQPALSAGSELLSSNSVHTGGSGNSIARGRLGSLYALSFAYEPYGTGIDGFSILNGAVSSSARTQFTERVLLSHPSLPNNTPVVLSATYRITGSRTSPDTGDGGNFNTYGNGSIVIGDGFASQSSPTWSSSGAGAPGTTITVNLSTFIGRTIFITASLQTAAGVTSGAITLRSVQASYGAHATLASSMSGVNLISITGHNFAPCAGDFNNDSMVDDADFSGFVLAYNILDCADPAMPSGCPADLNRDGLVDDGDFSIFVLAYDALLCP